MRKSKKKWISLLLALFIFIISAPTVHAQTSESENKEEILAPYFIIQNPDSAVDRFPLKETSVTTNINGVIAETYVTQVYANEGENPINASYVFPASSNVTVHGMTMEIGNQRVTAQIKEKEEAKQEFEQAKSEGKSASLLQQQRPNVFTMDVANIMPGDTARIELHYTELIGPVDGSYEFVFPTVVGPRCLSPSEIGNPDSAWVETPYLPDGDTPPGKYNITVNLSTGVPITKLSSKSHEINVSKKGDSMATVTLSNPSDYAGNRDFILKYKLTGEELQSGLVLTRGESENYFMLTVQPPERFVPEDIPPREYIFVLDVSGSMFGYPLDTAKTLIHDLVSGLKETDKFNLILFSGTSIQMSPESLPATEDNIKEAFRLIDQEDGSGWTSLAPALEDALAIPMDETIARSIVVITDGYISGEQNIFDIINGNMNKASFFSFGIGSSVNDYLIKGIATAGLGESFIVTDEEDALSTADKFRTYIQSPLLTDIQVTYDGFDVFDVEPAVPSTLFASKPIVLFGKWQGEPSGIITITGKTGNQDYEQKIQVSDIKAMEQSNAICYLWARNRLERLMDYGYSKDDPEVKDEVTQIGLTYSIMTPYTSFIAVIDEIRNPEANSTDVDQPLPLPLKVSNLAVGGGYRAYSEPEDIILIMTLAGVVIINLLIRKKRYQK
ncbi:MAG: VWA domain-containing protein [Lachnospiraceae bacterium]|nr:VWA domain-containing protein [Lachnospiraceae bacterium]